MKKIVLFLLLFSFSLAQAQQKGNIYAVCVGVSQYQNPRNNLNYCDDDALEMYNLLTLQTSSARLKLLQDQNATKSNIIAHATDLFTKTKPEDIVIFFFSGHGYKGGFVSHDSAIDYADLKAIFKKTKAKRKIIFADACFSGALRTDNSSGSINNSNSNVGSNVLTFLSSRTTQTSVESSQFKNGYFTYFLLAGLKGGADANKDKKITARELFKFVNSKVKEWSQGKQIPVMWGKFDDNMVIFNWNKQ